VRVRASSSGLVAIRNAPPGREDACRREQSESLCDETYNGTYVSVLVVVPVISRARRAQEERRSLNSLPREMRFALFANPSVLCNYVRFESNMLICIAIRINRAARIQTSA